MFFMLFAPAMSGLPRRPVTLVPGLSRTDPPLFDQAWQWSAKQQPGQENCWQPCFYNLLHNTSHIPINRLANTETVQWKLFAGKCLSNRVPCPAECSAFTAAQRPVMVPTMPMCWFRRLEAGRPGRVFTRCSTTNVK